MVPALNATNPVNSAWTFNKANLIPYVWEWVNSPSRECGLVQTQTWRQHKGGGGEWIQGSSGTTMPDNWRLAYQMNGYQGYWGHRITWAVDYGFLGTAAGKAPRPGWTVAVMLDQKSDSGVAKLIQETEKIQTTGGVAFTAVQGTVVTSGPKASGDSVVANYAPAGFNHVYRCWEFTPDAANIARFNFNVPAGSYHSPVFALENYTGSALPTTVSKNGTDLTGTDYFASLDQTNHRLWITIIGTINGNNMIGINSSNTTVGIRAPLSQRPMNAPWKIIGRYNLAGKSVTSSSGAGNGEKADGIYILRRSQNGVEKMEKTVR
jgi:hypothetical protein